MKNQNLNIGDKLLCKNSSKNLSSNEFPIYSGPSLSKGLEYEIVDIKYNHENIDTGYYYYVSQNNNRIVGHTNEFLFYTSFYTKNEIRKIKLNKLINEESKS